jgi:uncharacterized membrane-anchored protein YhcB (DUF1043 family)
MKDSTKALIATLVIGVICGIFFTRNLMHKQSKPQGEILRDSVKFYENKAQVHFDSAEIFTQKANEDLQKYDFYLHADSLYQDSVRAEYRTRLRARIAGHSDSVRVN